MRSAKTARKRTLSLYENDKIFDYIFDEIDKAINEGKFRTIVKINNKDHDRFLAIQTILCDDYGYLLKLYGEKIGEDAEYTISWQKAL
jgi:hypothetical protein